MTRSWRWPAGRVTSSWPTACRWSGPCGPRVSRHRSEWPAWTSWRASWRRAGEHRLRVYFLGARREVVTALVERTKAQHPGLEIAGFRDGYFGPDDHLGIVEEIRASGAHMLFVGMPTPFKETWCERHRQRLDVPVIMGVGGSFDVLAGFIKRAPRWIQSLGLEWFWRLSDGASQAVEALPHHQQRVHLARRPGDHRPPPGLDRRPQPEPPLTRMSREP